VVEGPHAIEAALTSGRHRVDELFVTPSAARRDVDLLRIAAADGVRVTLVTDRVAGALSDTVTPQGAVAVVRPAASDLAAVLGGAPAMVVVLVDVAEPGNAGTVIRTADAAGAGAVVLAGDSVDPYNPKCVRASAGSLFHLPVVQTRDPLAVITSVKDAGLSVVATAADAERELYAADTAAVLRGRVAWLLGNEAHGLPADVADAADLRVRIPIIGRAESLNLAAAASVCLYETARLQREAP